MSNLISKIAIASENESSGFVQYDLKDANAVHTADKGVANGVATLDNAGKVPSSQLPSYVDDVIEGYYHDNKFYSTYTPDGGGTYSDEIPAETGKIYVDKNTSISYRWSGTTYIIIGSSEVVQTTGTSTIAVMSQSAVTQELSNKADVDETVSTVSYDTTNKKITKTIDGTTTDVVTVSLIKTDLELNNVTNDAQVKRSEMGVANGVATLDSISKIPTSQIPTATTDNIGGVKVGNNLSIDSNGVLSSANPEKLGFGIGTCTTSAATTAKEVSITGYELVKNASVTVTFENSVPAGATLNVSSKGAKPIYFKGEAIIGNVINAGDTVTFCYDGTNYVVSSPINLSKITFRTYSDAEKTTPISAVIDITFANGDKECIKTNNGIYTLYHSDGNVSFTSLYADFDIHSFVVNGDTTVDIVVTNTDYVDLGLPSGTLWARGNICKDANGNYYMGNPEENGCYSSAGNIDGYNRDEVGTGEGKYSFTAEDYALTPGSQMAGNIASNDAEHDITFARLGEAFHIPSSDNYSELLNTDYTTTSSTSINGVGGVLFTSKINGNTLFIPKCGISNNGNIDASGNGYYGLSNIHPVCWYLLLAGNGGLVRNGGRYTGYTIRAVV